ncbi:uncharacterized protein LOC117639899 isoform X3 [Thrips palmi]|uniref:Uncharacterized protein LOC117639899 isoform X3 n=1 Tax=Thrips palmi TaxID=161013 RepID=A0A6P8ZHF5_THRPL|nr:uncharacterized protein LOC117639899 isoform X3 [Thrips palmi]
MASGRGLLRNNRLPSRLDIAARAMLADLEVDAATVPPFQLSLATLPEDELLRVLGFLGTKELLQCRAVCRRLRDLALHPSLWRSRSLGSLITRIHIELVATTLRLAPCLDKLYLRMDMRAHPHEFGTLLVSTNCAIRCLGVSMSLSNGLYTAMALERQAALGRLNAVTVTLCRDYTGDSYDDSSKYSSELRLLLNKILHTQGLASVEVKVSGYPGIETFPQELCLLKAAKGDVHVPPSLRRLVYEPGLDDEANLTSYLQWHASTLQSVNACLQTRRNCALSFVSWPDNSYLQRVVHFSTDHPHAAVTPLLCSLPHLRELQCGFLENMPALLQCSELKSLHLFVNVDDSTRPLLPGVEQYIRTAVTRLQTLTLEYPNPNSVNSDPVCVDALNLLLKLAGPSKSAAPALVNLTILYTNCFGCEYAWAPQPQLPPLAAVLHRLKHLVTLDLNGPPTPSFFAAMDGEVLPSLKRLSFRADHPEWGWGCPHEWCHGEEPRAILRRYPRLHLVVSPSHVDDECTFCTERDCHEFYEETDHILFSHPVDARCDQDHSEDFHIVV